MREISTNTIKYYRLAIYEFLPYIENLQKESQNENIKEELGDLIDMYKDVAKKIDSFNLILDDPNRHYDSEPFEIPSDKLGIDDKIHEYFSRLSLNLLNKWKEKQNRLEKKGYLTEQNKEEIYKLKNLIWPLEAQFNNQSKLFYRNKMKGPIEFPIEKIVSNQIISDGGLFPASLLKKIHPSIKKLCEEFNFCYENNKPDACLLLLRKILPLSIIRRFEQLNIQEQIKDNDGFLDTKQLLGKAQTILSDKRIYKDIMSCKTIIDASQHIFTFEPAMLDVRVSGNTIRVFLEDLFFQKEE